MSDPLTQAQLQQRVCQAVAEALALDPSQVLPEHNLFHDLGAESLDLLDVVFKLERSFGIQITRGEMEQAARGDMTEEEFAPQGELSAAGLERLRELMPESAARIQPGLRPAQILELFTVSTFATIVHKKLAAAAEA